MAVDMLFMDGFDHYSNAEILKRWDTATAISSGFVTGRTGSGSALAMLAGDIVRVALDPAKAGGTYTKLLVGLAFKSITIPTSANQIIFALDSVTNATGAGATDLRMSTSTGLLELRRNGTVIATGTTALVANTWYYIELKVEIASGATGSYTVWLNGNVELGPTSSVQTSSVANVTTFRLFTNSSGAGTSSANFDDIVVQNWATAGVSNLGDVSVVSLLPSGAGNYTQFTPSAGSNYQNVDDATPNGDTDYNADATVSDKDSFAMGNLPSNGTPYAVQALTYARKDDAGSRTLRNFLRISGTDYEGASKTVSDSYQYHVDMWNSDPSGGAWDQSKVDALEAGYKVQA